MDDMEEMEEMRSLRELCPEAVPLKLPKPLKAKGNRVHILALGDVGATLLLGLKILGGCGGNTDRADITDRHNNADRPDTGIADNTASAEAGGVGLIGTIGIFDVNPAVVQRYEIEMNQIGMPFCGGKGLPQVVAITEEQLFNCDMFVFCASKGVPALGAKGDVRMMQFEANRNIVEAYAKRAGEEGYKGIFAIVSDPVDPLCKAALLASGLAPAQIRGYGLGVMNMRAEYFAKQDSRLEAYLTEGRAYGPHGSDLVIANSLVHYDDDLSKALTRQTVEANLKVRELGFKPYVAPAMSSGAISLLLTLQGRWHYSSIYFGRGRDGAFLGVKNRIAEGSEALFEDIPLPPKLYERINCSYRNLCDII